MNDLFGTPVKENAGQELCQCGCGMPVPYRGYGRPRKYVSRQHAALARRELKQYETSIMRDSDRVSRQHVAWVLEYLTEQSTVTTDIAYVMRVLIDAPMPVAEFVRALHDVIAMCASE